MRHVIKVPIGILDAAHNIVVQIETDSGYNGWGETSPFEPITGDTQHSNLLKARQLSASLLGKDPLAISNRTTQLRKGAGHQTSILCAFDTALYDIAGKARGVPVYQLLGGTNRVLRSDFTVGMQDTIDETLAIVDEGFAHGFNEVKLKVGRSGLDDVDFVAAVRAHCAPGTRIKIDSNQGWDYDTALSNLQAMEKLDIQYSEQPVAASDYESLKRLRKNTSIPICADESVFDDEDAQRLVKSDSVDYLNIKLVKSGGIYTGLKINSIAEQAGLKCMVGCFAESRLGLTAAAHFAIACPNICFIDLDSAFDLEEDPIIGGASFNEQNGGNIFVDDAPGFGAELKTEYIERCLWASI